MRKPMFVFEKYTTKLSILWLILGMCGGAIGVATAAFYSNPVEVAAESASWTPDEEEKVVDRTELALNITSSALTDTSQSVGCVFRSQKVEVVDNGPQYKNVYSTPNDPNFTTITEMKDLCKAEKDAAEAAGKTFEMPVYEAQVYNITYNKSASRIKNTAVIPEYLSYSDVFQLHVTSIGSSVVFDQSTGETNYGGIQRIVIPKHVASIADGAFVEMPDMVEIYVEAPEYYENEEGELVKTYDNEWAYTDSEHIHYGYELTADEQKVLSQKSSSYKSLGTGADFFLGIEEENYDLPLYMEYHFMTQDEEGGWYYVGDTQYQKLEINSTNTNYDAVGSSMGVNSISPYIEVDLPKGYRVDVDSIIFHNIYRAVPEYDGQGNPTGKMIPDVAEGPHYSRPAVSQFEIPHFSDLFSFDPGACATAPGFLQFSVLLHREAKDGYGIYPEMNSTLFSQHKSEIDDKTLQIRYQFSTLDRASYRFTFVENGTERQETVRVSTPISYVLTNDKDTRLGFLVEESRFERFNFNNLTKVELCGFSVKMDLYKSSTNSILTKSAVSVRFGALALFNNIHELPRTDLVTYFIVAYSIFVGAYLLLAVAYYFYAKRRFRNDEFRRVNAKSFVITALKNFIGCALLLSSILFIVGRWVLLYSTVVVFNPLDVFVVVFTIAAAIYVGFTIKNLINSIKNAKKRRQALRLHLDDDVDDDGTH